VATRVEHVEGGVVVRVLQTCDGGLAQSRALSQLRLVSGRALARPSERQLDRQLRRNRNIDRCVLDPSIEPASVSGRCLSGREVSLQPARQSLLGALAMSSPGSAKVWHPGQPGNSASVLLALFRARASRAPEDVFFVGAR